MVIGNRVRPHVILPIVDDTASVIAQRGTVRIIYYTVIEADTLLKYDKICMFS